MFKLANKLMGSLLRGLVFLPFSIVAAALVPFLFVDRLIQGRLIDALRELYRIPLKVGMVLVDFNWTALNGGWKSGLTGMLSSLPSRLAHFFTREPFIDSNEYLSVKPIQYETINHLEGPLFGALVRKLYLFVHRKEAFKNYEQPDISNLLAMSTENMIKNGLGQKLQADYNAANRYLSASSNAIIDAAGIRDEPELVAGIMEVQQDTMLRKFRRENVRASRYYARFLVKAASAQTPVPPISKDQIDLLAEDALRTWTPAAQA